MKIPLNNKVEHYGFNRKSNHQIAAFLPNQKTSSYFTETRSKRNNVDNLFRESQCNSVSPEAPKCCAKEVCKNLVESLDSLSRQINSLQIEVHKFSRTSEMNHTTIRKIMSRFLMQLTDEHQKQYGFSKNKNKFMSILQKIELDNNTDESANEESFTITKQDSRLERQASYIVLYPAGARKGETINNRSITTENSRISSNARSILDESNSAALVRFPDFDGIINTKQIQTDYIDTETLEKESQYSSTDTEFDIEIVNDRDFRMMSFRRRRFRRKAKRLKTRLSKKSSNSSLFDHPLYFEILLNHLRSKVQPGVIHGYKSSQGIIDDNLGINGSTPSVSGIAVDNNKTDKPNEIFNNTRIKTLKMVFLQLYMFVLIIGILYVQAW